MQYGSVRFAIALTALGLVAVFCATSATAQERQKPHTLFDLLFGSHTNTRNTKTDQYQPRRKVIIRRSTTASGSSSADQPAVKVDNAKHILVVGDFMASALADGLKDAFSDTAGVVVDESTSGSSGLVRNDYYDWLAKLPQIMDEDKPSLLVVEIGSNDRQKMAVDGVKEDFQSDEWTTEYEKRVAGMVSIALKRGVPVLWTGLPSFQSPSFTADIVTINQIQRRQVEAAGATFVDIWDGFVDENGKYTATGFDVDGQQARLRGSDGISLTSAGKDKLAFYVEKYARRLLGDAALPNSGGLNGDLGNTNIIMPQGTGEQMPVRTRPMSMTDPAIDGSTALASPMNQPVPVTESPRDRLLHHGDPGPVPEGRIDDFTWKKN